ncbi:YfhO family protein [Melittangium boletus]|uniref:YfhO family protein n=1 Tax=Melittangium boletus DSM 14713 TaxID=1294270 RepID=A0A250IT90_9BACT|nr:YfhO family protein [Melittangium boletus]ATB34462.1 hypothetical protein MEBOL_007965 [Melittangium boletus DSM 14713]
MPLPAPTRSRLAVVFATLAIPLLYFHRATFTDKVFIARDILRVYYPLKKYWVERVSQFQFPEWYPYDGLGQPYPGMLISGAFHPTNLLYLLLPLETALKLITLGAYVAALAGTYRFARLWGQGRGAALLAGLTYALSGYLVCISNNLLYLMAAATFPWALWGAERFLREPSARRAAAAAVPLCLVLLSGDPQSFALCNGALLGLVLLRPRRSEIARAVPRALLLIALGVLLSSVQILPVLGVLGDAQPTAATLEKATSFSFHPLRLLELALGPLFLDPNTGSAPLALADELLQSGMQTLWVDSVHLGAPALVLLGVALWVHRREPLTWKVAGGALLVLALAMARHLPFYGWLYRWMPFWNSFRYPEKLLPYFLFACALGVGAGGEAVRRGLVPARRLGQVVLGLAAGWGVLLLGEWGTRWFSDGVIRGLWARAQPEVLEMLQGNFLLAAGSAAGMLAVMGGVLLWVSIPERRAGLLIALQLAVLFLANEHLYLVTYPDVLHQPTSMVDAILRSERDAGAGRPRVYAAVPKFKQEQVPEGLERIDITSINSVTILEPDTPALWNLESALSYLPTVSSRYFSLEDRLGAMELLLGRFAGLFHVRYVVVQASEYAKAGGNADVVVAEEPRFNAVLLRNPRVLPRAYLATPVCEPDVDAARARVFSRAFQPGRQVVLECPPGAPEDAPPAGDEPGQVRFVRYTPEHVELDVEARRSTVLVLNDAWYSGWSATVDGQPAPILPANVAVRGLRLPAGTHRVTFTYQAAGLRLGAGLSLGGLALLALALWYERRERSG